MLLIFLGPPGSGKGTQSERLATDLGIEHLSTGGLLRQAVSSGTPLGQQAAEYLDGGQLVPDSLVVNLVGQRLDHTDCAKGCLLDGFPRSLTQAETLDQYLTEHESRVDMVIELQVDPQELRRRMLGRAQTEGRSDDTPETIAERIKVYNSTTAPLVDYYHQLGILHVVDGMGTSEQVYLRVKDVIDRHRNE